MVDFLIVINTLFSRICTRKVVINKICIFVCWHKGSNILQSNLFKINFYYEVAISSQRQLFDRQVNNIYVHLKTSFSQLAKKIIGRLYMTSHLSRQKKSLTKSSNLCWRGIGQTPTFGVILKTNEKSIKIWNELLLVGYSEINKFDQKQFG